jgi:4-hydroxybenzoate polyprenyltransferase
LSLLLYVALTFPKIPLSIKFKMRVVSLLSLIASFIISPLISEFFCICALGLAVNTAYEIDLAETSTAVNTSLGIAQIISYWSESYLQKSTINRDIVILIFTLPNIFLS